LPNRDSQGRIADPTFIISAAVCAKNIAGAQYPILGRNAVHQLIIDTGRNRSRKGRQALRGFRIPFKDWGRHYIVLKFLPANFIQLRRAYTRPGMPANFIQHPGDNFALPAASTQFHLWT